MHSACHGFMKTKDSHGVLHKFVLIAGILVALKINNVAIAGAIKNDYY